MVDPNNPFADLVPSSQDVGVINGPPKPVDPIAAQSSALDLQKKQREAAGLNPDGTPKDSPADAAKSTQQQVAGFYERALNANRQYGAGVAPRGIVGQAVADILPTGVVRTNSSPERRAADTFAADFIAATLRKESGAAISKDEYVQQYARYFPQVGDSPQDLANKAQLRQVQIDSLKIGAGPAAAEVEKRLGYTPPTSVTPPDHVGTNSPSEPPPLEVNVVGGREPTAAEIAADPVKYADWKNAKDTEARAAALRTQQDAITGKPSDAGTLLGQGATLGLSDEAAGVGTGINELVHGRNPIPGYLAGRDAERLRIEEARKRGGWGGTALEMGGGFLSANPEAIIAPATSALSTIAQGAKTGAYGGALAGWGSGNGLQDSVEKGVVGAGFGSVLGAGVSGVSARLASRGMDPALAGAAQAEGVDMVRPMIDPASRQRLANLEAAPGSQPVIQRAIDRTRGQIEGRLQQVGNGGDVLDTMAAGDRVQGAGRRFIERSRGVADRLYTRARSLAGDAKVDPQQALGQAQRELADLQQNPETNAGEINFLQGVVSDLSTPGGKSVDGLRSIRQSLRGRINEQNLTATQAEARATRILDAAQQDVGASLPDGAATAFRRADSYYRERMTHIDDVTSRFLGKQDSPLSSEQAFTRLKAMASPGGDGRRLSAMMRNLEPSEQNDVAATIAHNLGRRDPEAPFSTALFVSQAQKLSPSARRTIFGQAGADSINNLLTLSRSLNDATSRLNNSGSGRVAIGNMAKSLVASLTGLGAMHGGAAGSVEGAVIGAGLVGTKMGINALSARALMSPRVARWLASTANASTPGQAQSAVRQLGTIISREPALAGELTPLQQSLEKLLATGGSPASEAQPAENNKTSQ